MALTANPFIGPHSQSLLCHHQNALLRCSWGIEFIWDNGSHMYPNNHPEESREIAVTDVFEMYTDGRTLFARIADAALGGCRRLDHPFECTKARPARTPQTYVL